MQMGANYIQITTMVFNFFQLCIRWNAPLDNIALSALIMLGARGHCCLSWNEFLAYWENSQCPDFGNFLYLLPISLLFRSFKNKPLVAGAIAQRLRTSCTALTEDVSLGPSDHLGWLTTACSFRELWGPLLSDMNPVSFTTSSCTPNFPSVCIETGLTVDTESCQSKDFV